MDSHDLLVYENEYFRAVHAACAIPGYLIVFAKEPAASLSLLSPAAQSALGPTLALLTRAVESVVHPERVYCLRIGEEQPQIHFHLFPRTEDMAEEYFAACGRSAAVNGARMFDWIRPLRALDSVPDEDRREVEATIQALRLHLG